MTTRSVVPLLLVGLLALVGLTVGATSAMLAHVQRADCERMGHVYAPAGPEGVSHCWVPR